MSDRPPSGRLALDIETISPGFGPDDDVDTENPERYELAAIGFAYDGPESHLPETEILLRETPSLEAEFEFIGNIKGVIEEFTWSTESDLTTQKRRALSARHS